VKQRIVGTHIGGQFACTGPDLRNDSGPALNADSLQVGQSVVMSGGCQVDCTGADLRNDSGPALNPGPPKPQ
jgi:hypothetical protein